MFGTAIFIVFLLIIFPDVVYSKSSHFIGKQYSLRSVASASLSFLFFYNNGIFGGLNSIANALDDPVAIRRFEASLKELTELDNNWISIVRSDGDNVRRRLGTVYSPPKCEPSLCKDFTYMLL